MVSALALQCSNQLSYENPCIGSRPICWIHLNPVNEMNFGPKTYNGTDVDSWKMRPMSRKGIITLEVTMVTMHAQTMQHHHSEQFQQLPQFILNSSICGSGRSGSRIQQQTYNDMKQGKATCNKLCKFLKTQEPLSTRLSAWVVTADQLVMWWKPRLTPQS